MLREFAQLSTRIAGRVVDSGGQLDEACAGDLTLLEAKAAGVSRLVIWPERSKNRG